MCMYGNSIYHLFISPSGVILYLDTMYLFVLVTETLLDCTLALAAVDISICISITVCGGSSFLLAVGGLASYT